MSERGASAHPRGVVAVQLLVILVLAAILVPAITPGTAMTSGAWVKLMFLGRVVVLLAVATWLLGLRGLGWSDLGLRRPNLKRMFLAIGLGAVASFTLVGILGAVLAQAGVHPANYAMFAPMKGKLWLYLFFLLPVTWGTAAFGEELLFRGFVLDALERLFGAHRNRLASVAAIVAQAMLFGALHIYQGVGGTLTAGAIGLALGAAWLGSGRNLWAGIILHGVFDSGAMTMIFLFGAGGAL